MPDVGDERRDAIHAFMQELGPPHMEEGKSAVLVGWAVVQDWMDGDGDRWIAKAHSPSIPRWHADGLHHEALYGDWADIVEEEDA